MAEPVAAPLPPASSAARRPVIPWIELALLVGFAVFPLLVPDYLADFGSRLLILSLFAISFDLVFGYAGILSFGQALFFGAAGYAVALMGRDLDISSALIVLPVSIGMGLVLGAAVAAFLLLGRHPPSLIFVALGTLTASFAGDQLARAWYYLGGQNGIPSIPLLSIGSFEFSGMSFFYLVLGVFVAVYGLCRLMLRSQFGLALIGIREQEVRLSFFGYHTAALKAVVFTIGGAIAGLAGGLYAYQQGFVWPSMIGIVLSTQIVLYCLFGGVGTLVGPILGVIGIEGVSYVLSQQYPKIWPILLGLLLLLVILVRPSGLISLVVSGRERIGSFAPRPRRAGHPVAERRDGLAGSP